VPKKEADNILDMIKARQGPNYKQPVKEIKSSDWYKFTSDFVEEMDGNKVNKETGMTNKEYLDYLKDRNSILAQQKKNMVGFIMFGTGKHMYFMPYWLLVQLWVG